MTNNPLWFTEHFPDVIMPDFIAGLELANEIVLDGQEYPSSQTTGHNRALQMASADLELAVDTAKTKLEDQLYGTDLDDSARRRAQYSNYEQLVANIVDCFDIAPQDKKPVYPMLTKLFEETGELAEAVNYNQGWLPHKTMKEPLAGEVADVINCVISVLVKCTPDLTTEERILLLSEQLQRKNAKWVEVIEKL